MHRRLLSLARSAPLPLIVTILAGLFGGWLIIAQAYLLSGVIERVFLKADGIDSVRRSLMVLLIVILGRAILSGIGEIGSSAVASSIKTALRDKLIARLIDLGPAFARGQRTGELSAAMMESVEALDAYFSQYLPQLVVSTLVPLSILIFVFPIDPLSGVILFLTAPLIPLFMILIGRTAEAMTKRQWETLSRLSAHFFDSLQGLTTLKIFGRSQAHARNIEEASARFRDITLKVLRVTFLSALVLELAATISTAIIAVEIGLRLLYAQMGYREALFLLILAPEFYVPLRMLGLRFHAGMNGAAAGAKIFAILDQRSADGGRLSVAGDPSLMSHAPCSILHFQSVSYRYADGAEPALNSIDLSINAGETIALIGASGAGKSSLVQLLLRFSEPSQGEICADDVSLRDLDPDEWRKQIAWVSQSPYLFHDTIRANILLSRPHATQDEMVAAARAACLDAFIDSLPEGYDTIIGEGGSRLSGGQAQRLALARAFLKDAPILILDEPTSSLDPETEAVLEQSTHNLMRGRTVILIAHRLNTIQNADRIVVLDQGRIAEQGRHDDLVARNGFYARLQRAYGQAGQGTSDPSDFVPSLTHPLVHPLAVPPNNQTTGQPFIRLLTFLNTSIKDVAFSVLLGALTIASSIGLIGTSSYLISAAALHPSIAELQVAIVGVRFFGIARGVFRYLERLVSHNVTFNLLARLRVWFYRKLEPLAPARLMQYRAGDLLARILADVEMLENFYVRVVAPPIVASLIIFGMGIFLGAYSSSLAWVLVAFLILLGVLAPLISQALSRHPARELILRRADLSVQVVDAVQGLADLMANGAQKSHREKFIRTQRAYASAQRRMAWISAFNAGITTLLVNLAVWILLVLAIPLVNAGQIPGVLLAMIVLASLASFEAVMPLPLAAQMSAASLGSAKRLFDVADSAPAVIDPPVPETPPVSGSISFRRINFRYAPNDPAALIDVDFDLPAGKSIAVVGPSGAGKSSIANLLLRFWETTEGSILIDGKPIQSFAQDDVRRLISYVSQNNFFFNATIEQNLRLARSKVSDDEIIEAAKRAQIHDFVMGLPQGYATWIGEKGARLSGGERQRLALARAFLKNAPLLILDEPTANLDAIAEASIFNMIDQLCKERSVLLITHRLINLDHFDEILVIDHGRIAERGSHAGLIARDGLYRRMWELQNRNLIV